jgi:hypothetical protein
MKKLCFRCQAEIEKAGYKYNGEKDGETTLSRVEESECEFWAHKELDELQERVDAFKLGNLVKEDL